MPLPDNNQYAPLAGNYEDNEDNKESIGVEDESTGADSKDNESTGVKSKSTVVTKENYESDKMALIE